VFSQPAKLVAKLPELTTGGLHEKMQAIASESFNGLSFANVLPITNWVKRLNTRIALWKLLYDAANDRASGGRPGNPSRGITRGAAKQG
jgi:hypothetical protein